MKKHIPNIITCCNLLSGSAAVVFACQSSFTLAFIFILLGALFDFFDGMSARLLKVGQPIGKELDSLADDITFGLAPTLILLTYLYQHLSWWALLVLPMTAFSALRLAKFNLDERQSSSFIGLATPANAIFWGSLVAYLSALDINITTIDIMLIVMSVFCCWLLVAEIPFFSLKFHNLTWRDNKIKFIFLIGSIVIIFTFIFAAIFYSKLTLILPIGFATIIWYITLAILSKQH